jgi:hypothetical protein
VLSYAPFIHKEGIFFMQFRTLCSLIVMAGALAACGSSKDASKPNFAKAIDAQLAKRCLTVSFGMSAMTTSTTFPVSVAITQPSLLISADQAKQQNERAFGPYDALAKAGLLTAADAPVQPLFGRDKVPGKVYALTDAGVKALKDPKYTTFCAGHYQVDEIVNFTEPGNAMGTTISRVTFTYSPKDVPAWVNDDGVTTAFPALAKQREAHQQGHAVMVLQNDGWSADLSTF